MAVCRICDEQYQPFIDFGMMPIANGFLKESEFEQEYFFPMKVGYCGNCHMVQLIEQPEREKMFHQDYAFFSSTSLHQQRHFKNFADHVLEHYVADDRPFVVELGSNDGIMLKNIADRGIAHLGIEPSANVAEVARQAGVNTLSEFFDENLAEKIVREYGHADAVTSANVICHIPYLHSVFAGVEKLLKPDGVFIYEDPYLGDIVEKVSYDQIYDEHVFYFSVASVSKMAAMHGMEVFDVEALPVHGGSMRYFIARQGSRPVSARVREQMAKENALGLQEAHTYERLRQRIELSREGLLKLLQEIKQQQGAPVIAYGATSKSTTVTNYCGIGPDLIAYISDTTPLKQGKYSPGMHIPVKAYEQFTRDCPQYTLLFAWNHQREILEKEEAYRKRGGKWLVYVPEVGIIE